VIFHLDRGIFQPETRPHPLCAAIQTERSMTNHISGPSPHWRAMTNNFSRLTNGLGGNLFRAYARRQCLIGIDGMLEMSDQNLAGYGTNRTALTKLRARLAAGEFPPPDGSRVTEAA
jgi:hypothetical protein